MDSEVSELEEYDNEKKNVEFVTSTPEKRKFECEECHEKTQCVDTPTLSIDASFF